MLPDAWAATLGLLAHYEVTAVGVGYRGEGARVSVQGSVF